MLPTTIFLRSKSIDQPSCASPVLIFLFLGDVQMAWSKLYFAGSYQFHRFYFVRFWFSEEKKAVWNIFVSKER
jgi:hypothetical protein